MEGRNTKFDERLNDSDREELARHIQEGYTQGIIDADGYRISWHIVTEKFEI